MSDGLHSQIVTLVNFYHEGVMLNTHLENIFRCLVVEVGSK